MGVPDECFVGPDGRRLPFRVEQRPGLGRCVVAARDIEPTELIISERAAAVGPVQVRSHSAVTDVLQLPCSAHRAALPDLPRPAGPRHGRGVRQVRLPLLQRGVRHLGPAHGQRVRGVPIQVRDSDN